MNNPIITTALVAVIVGGAAFAGGMKFQQLRGDSRFAPTWSDGEMMGGRFTVGQGSRLAGDRRKGQGGLNRMMVGGPITGEITAKDDSSITVKTVDGSSTIVLLSDVLNVAKTDEGSRADLTVGAKVGVFGTENSDGSITAQTIQLNPMFQQRGVVTVSPTPAPKQ